jgi:hypothetical protein
MVARVVGVVMHWRVQGRQIQWVDLLDHPDSVITVQKPVFHCLVYLVLVSLMLEWKQLE